MSNLSTLPKGDSAWLLRKAIERIIQQVSVLETNIGASTSGNSANTQIIFNDNGTLRGDAGLVYNKTTDTLTAGSATITGDLTVRTNKLLVTATGVGVGAAPVNPFDVVSTAGTLSVFKRTGSNGAFIGIQDGSGGLAYLGYTNGVFSIQTSGSGYSDKYTIATDGTATWSVAGTTAMTLNSTGLGIGAIPSYPLDVLGSSNAGILAVTCSSQVSSIRLRQTAVINVATRNWEINTNSTAYGNLEFRVGASAQSDTYSTAVTFDSSANIFAKGIAGTSLVTVTALATDYALPGGAFAGLIVIRSNGGGGSAVFMVDPNAGAVSISNNIVGRTITLTYSGGAWQFQQTVGAVTSTYNYLILATQ